MAVKVSKTKDDGLEKVCRDTECREWTDDKYGDKGGG